ncbi:MAG TPA: riboflavin synthase [bacterium]|nr:riboflavin synthase [bacterium]HQL63768.1 riboflavin synthase [bacterium]
MFTGIIRAVGRIRRTEHRPAGVRMAVTCPEPMRDVEISDSVAVNGVCLTVTELSGDGFTVDVSKETLSRSSLSMLQPGAPVNIETSLRLGDKLGGHLVFGHVDGLGTITQLRQVGDFYDLTVEFPAELSRYIAEKGSISIDGISLTVATLSGNRLTVAVIPYTFEQTVLKYRRVGDRVNLEVDMLARYVERMLHADSKGELSKEFLAEHGFL